MVDVSIIIVNWNTKDLLLQCLDSLIRTTKQCSIEVIVVDNNSTDGSPEAVKKKFPQVKVIRNETNLGFAKANNIGIRNSSGRYVCLVNSDIEVLDGCVDRMSAFMDHHTSVGILGPKTLNPDKTLRINCKEFPNLWNTFCRTIALEKVFPRSKLFSDGFMHYFDHNSIKCVDVLPGCFLMVRKEAADEVGLLDERYFFYGEDKDWCKRMQISGRDVVFFPDSEVIHYAGKSAGKTPVRFLIEGLRSNAYYWEKHHGKVARILFQGLMLLFYFIRLGSSFFLYMIKPTERDKYSVQLSGSATCARWLINAIFCKQA